MSLFADRRMKNPVFFPAAFFLFFEDRFKIDYIFCVQTIERLMNEVYMMIYSNRSCVT